LNIHIDAYAELLICFVIRAGLAWVITLNITFKNFNPLFFREQSNRMWCDRCGH
jgi:hypothetical protein